MADGAGDNSPSRLPAKEEQKGGERGESSEEEGDGGLTEAQRVVLERCIRALKEAKRDSQTLAALLLITRLCPANNLDKETLRRIFEAVGLNLPARLLVAAFRKTDNASLSPLDILALGTALLAALSTDPDMTLKPQLLSCIPILLGIIANGPTFGYRAITREYTGLQAKCGPAARLGWQHARQQGHGESSKAILPEEASTPCELDEAMASDCYQVLSSVCASHNGPEHLLRRGAVVALCHAIGNNQTSSLEKGLPLLRSILSSKVQGKAWSKHARELLDLLVKRCRDFCQATPEQRLDMCTSLVQFLPPATVAGQSQELREVVTNVWGALKPMLQSKLTASQIGPMLVLAASLLDVYGWQPVGSPKFCCLVVNRASVEVRMGLERRPGAELNPEQQEILTGCYRIMETAMEQVYRRKDANAAAQSAIPTLSPQRTRQLQRVLEEVSSAAICYLRHVDTDQYDDPFVFSTFRCLCVLLSEETYCLKEEVVALLPFLIDYIHYHIQRGCSGEDLPDRMALMSMKTSEEEESWTGREALRFFLPGLCHMSAAEGPRRVLISLDVPALLVDFLMRSWTALKEKSRVAFSRSPSMETACSVLLNFISTEPGRVWMDPCFKALEALLSESLPLLVTKPCLLVLTAYYCTLGLMMGALETTSGSIEPPRRRFFSCALGFLRNALESSSCTSPARVSASWEGSWGETAELWTLSMQALGACVHAEPAVAALVREEGWLRHTLSMLDQCSAMPDPQTQEALEDALRGLARICPLCKMEIRDGMKNERGALATMTTLKKVLD